MKHDAKVPEKLAHLQRWFASIITQKMAQNHTIATLSPSGSPIECEALQYILQTPVLGAKDRMQIYNQSYWLRLLSALHEEYPFLTCLFGIDSFNESIGIPYLAAYPPSHWSLNLLGKNLLRWIKEIYREEDLALVQVAAEIDWACQQSFFVKGAPLLDLSQFAGKRATDLITLKLTLQPHVHLLQAWGHFMNYREAFLAHEPDYWLDHDFPLLVKEKTHCFIIFRNPRLRIEWDELQPEEYQMLKLLQEGISIEEACDRVQERTDTNLERLEEEIAFWVQKWLIKQWLTFSP